MNPMILNIFLVVATVAIIVLVIYIVKIIRSYKLLGESLDQLTKKVDNEIVPVTRKLDAVMVKTEQLESNVNKIVEDIGQITDKTKLLVNNVTDTADEIREKTFEFYDEIRGKSLDVYSMMTDEVVRPLSEISGILNGTASGLGKIVDAIRVKDANISDEPGDGRIDDLIRKIGTAINGIRQFTSIFHRKEKSKNE
jgi:uncharacterized protein YoxC